MQAAVESESSDSAQGPQLEKQRTRQNQLSPPRPQKPGEGQKDTPARRGFAEISGDFGRESQVAGRRLQLWRRPRLGFGWDGGFEPPAGPACRLMKASLSLAQPLPGPGEAVLAAAEAGTRVGRGTAALGRDFRPRAGPSRRLADGGGRLNPLRRHRRSATAGIPLAPQPPFRRCRYSASALAAVAIL